MNKVIYEIRPLAPGKLNADLYKMIEWHNSRTGRFPKKHHLTFALIEAHVMSVGTIGLLNPSVKIFEDVMMIAENGVHTMTIREIEFVGEVTETETNLLNLENLS